MDSETAKSLLNLAELAIPIYRGLEARAALDQFEQRHAELLEAMQWFIDEERPDSALRLASSLALFWTGTKRLQEGSGWFDRVLAVPGGDETLRGRALFDAGLMAFWMGDDQRSTALHSRALEIGRRIGDPTVMALALTGMARIALRSAAGFEEARRLCREAVSLTEGTADRLGRSSAIHVLGVVAQMSGEFTEARRFMVERIALAREQGNMAAVGVESGNLSMVERKLGNLEQSEVLARQALEICARREDEWAIPFGFSALADIATRRGNYARAARLIGAAEALMEAQGAQWPPDEVIHYERVVKELGDALGAAEFPRLRALGRTLAGRDAIDLALGGS